MWSDSILILWPFSDGDERSPCLVHVVEGPIGVSQRPGEGIPEVDWVILRLVLSPRRSKYPKKS